MPSENLAVGRERRLRKRARLCVGIVMMGLVVSGLTAFPLLTELEWLTRWLGLSAADSAGDFVGWRHWILIVREGLRETNANYPFLAYGTDWLAFAHLVMAIFFLGPLYRPENNRWTILSGMIACALVIVLAMIAGPIRGIPLYWRLIDCSFGVFGFIPLWVVWRDAGELAEVVRRRSR